MSEELNKQLSDLASKLGITVEHLWAVLVRQAYIDGISSLMTILVCGIAAVASLYAFFYLRPKFKEKLQPDNPFSMLMEPTGFLILGVVLIVIFSIAAANFYWVVSDFFNPEFYAWRQLPGVR